jgi:apolipoprotein N-acyltransferase
VLLAGIGGGLHFLGYAGHGVWPFAFVSLVPLFAALERTLPLRLGASALVGLVFGEVAHAGGYPWLWRLVDVFLGGDVRLGAALWLAHSLWYALAFALFGVVFRALRRRGRPIAVAALPPLLAIEAYYPQLFPGHLGDGLVDRTAWVQIVDLGGPLLLSALVALVNVALFELLRWRRGAPPPVAIALGAAIAVALALGYGAARIADVSRSLAKAPALRVGVVQGNLAVLDKRRDPRRVHQLYLEQTRELLAGGVLDLVVWPETVYSRGLQGPFPISGTLIREELRVPLLFGGVAVRGDTGRSLRYNSALLIGADGVIRDVYDKNQLVPFAEYLPFAALAGPLAEAFPHAQAFSAGGDAPPLTLGSWRIATPICSESADPAEVRKLAARARPHLFVSLANDGWFGDSAEPWIHLAVARMRAVEHKRSFVHATNTGVSAVVDPLGRLVARSGLLTRESLRAEVRLLEGPTVYGRLGDWPGWLALAGLAAGLIPVRLRARA